MSEAMFLNQCEKSTNTMEINIGWGGEKKRGALQNVSVDRWQEIVCLFFSFPRVTFVLLPPSGKSIPSQIYYT